MDALQAEMADGPLSSARSKERYYQSQARTHGQQDLRGSSGPTPPPSGASASHAASPEQVQRLLAGYIKSSVAWPQSLPATLSEEVLRDRVSGCLLWGATGDALGRPLNGLGPEEIRARYGRDGLTRYIPPLDWRSGAKGVFTSATGLTIELAHCLIASDGHLKPDDLAQRLARWQPNGRPMGQATEAVLRALAAGAPWWQVAGRTADDCGAAVRAAPVGLVHALETTPLALRQAAVLSALPTHAAALAVAGSVALAAGVAWLVREVARGANQIDARELSDFLSAAISGIEPPATDSDPQLVQRLRDLPHLLARPTPEQAFTRLHDGASTLDAVPTALYCFLRSPDDPRQVVLAAANSGISASSVASMAGQLAGAWCGAERLWRDTTPWWDDLEEREALRDLGDQLTVLAVRGAAH
jgi:poly(ADP-ribose) glycohydrolase ARH3